MSLAAGTRLGPYEIMSPLGAGGMGEVYRARDTRLGREVAIKVLLADVSADDSRRRRFEQEARSASALNHPNIVTVYDVGSVDSTIYLAMELVEGRTLREMLADGALAPRRMLEIAVQVADGLAKAHDAGLVHRDLKPENLIVSKDGFVKILDFGLAKLTETTSSGGLSVLPTVAGAPGTVPGTVMGTVGYMSPEQASGREVDYRSDQFS
ncbi:MAG TPA: serine/threonine-protein kinase, partial [Thermoanaerobaculia bacterium]|nr:serine/threonine-protein kinase [Thermoanaerobaculia bacterium]